MDFPAVTTIIMKYVFPPVFYALHGWLATWMAISALFRPYEAWYFPFTNWQIPCTPGIFPKRRNKLAQHVAGTITDTLLTTNDVKAQVESLVTEQNIYLAVDSFVDAVLREFRDTEKLHRLARDISELSPALLQQYMVTLVDGVEKKSDRRVASMLEKLFDHVILSTRISKEQSEEFAERIMENMVNPTQIRTVLVNLLTPQNIGALDDSIQAHATPPLKLLARIINVKNVCNESRKFMETDPEKANKVISDLIKRFELKEQIAQKIMTFDMRAMPLQSISNLRTSLISFAETFLVEHKQDLISGVERIQGEAVGTVQAAIIRFNPSSIPEEWLEKIKREVSAFIYFYLKRELGALLEQAIPKLGTYGMIANKIEQFSPQQLEVLVLRICKTELKWLEFLGGFIGFWLGIVQVCVNLTVH
ncbi:MAG: DUF445 family protein [Candidatus Obscuribacterales bacterium]|nr:DUF445 family protein [Candidatus Obscuribacterales bacterium]